MTCVLGGAGTIETAVGEQGRGKWIAAAVFNSRKLRAGIRTARNCGCAVGTAEAGKGSGDPRGEWSFKVNVAVQTWMSAMATHSREPLIDAFPKRAKFGVVGVAEREHGKPQFVNGWRGAIANHFPEGFGVVR